MAPYSTVALHTFSMEQVYSCGISNVYLYEYIYHAYLCALARHYVYIISTWICTHTCTRTLTSSHMCTHTLKLHIHNVSTGGHYKQCWICHWQPGCVWLQLSSCFLHCLTSDRERNQGAVMCMHSCVYLNGVISNAIRECCIP